MEDPGPNVLEQQIETNRLLALILAGAAAAPLSSPGLAGGGRAQWPTIFAWVGGTKHPFLEAGTAGYSISVVTDDREHLSHDSAIYMQCASEAVAIGQTAELDIGIPMPPSRTPRIQLAFMTDIYPYSCDLNVTLIYENGTNKLTAAVRLKGSTRSLEYLNSGGTYTELLAGACQLNPSDWVRLDLSVNFPDAKYSFVGVNQAAYHIPTIDVQSGAGIAVRRLTLNITLITGSTSQYGRCWLDEILVTDHLYAGPE